MSHVLRKKIDAAKNEMLEAEHGLEEVLRAIRVAPRAEKTTISSIVEAAFAKLSAARARVVDLDVELQKLLPDEDDDAGEGP